MHNVLSKDDITYDMMSYHIHVISIQYHIHCIKPKNKKKIILYQCHPMCPYCWWLKSCTSWWIACPIIYKVLYIPGGAGFQPSTVWIHFHQKIKIPDSLAPVRKTSSFLGLWKSLKSKKSRPVMSGLLKPMAIVNQPLPNVTPTRNKGLIALIRSNWGKPMVNIIRS